MMKLSVIIPTLNRSVLLEKVLISLSVQTFSQEQFEVIVVDNGSTDTTYTIVNSYATRIKNLLYFFDSRPGLHVGRHKGFFEASSDILVYIDDDIEAWPTWLQTIYDSFTNKEIVLVGGRCLPKFEVEPPEWLKIMWMSNVGGVQNIGHLSLIDLGDNVKLVNPFHVYGCNFAIRRSILFEAGGFHPDAMPQELIRFRGDGESSVSKFIKTKGYKALYHPLASIYHWVPKSRMTTEYFCRRAYNQGISDSYSAIRKTNANVYEINIYRQDFFRWLGSITSSKILSSILSIGRCSGGFLKGCVGISCEEDSLRRNLDAAYQKGYIYHQEQVKKSPELLDWVLKPDYWDCKLKSPVDKQ